MGDSTDGAILEKLGSEVQFVPQVLALEITHTESPFKNLCIKIVHMRCKKESKEVDITHPSPVMVIDICVPVGICVGVNDEPPSTNIIPFGME